MQKQLRKYKQEDNQSLMLEVAASGDDVPAQIYTLTRLMPKPDRPELDQTDEEPQVDQPKNQAGAQVPPQSGSSERADSEDFEANSGKTQLPAVSSKEQVKQTSASLPSRDQPSPDERTGPTFDAIKREWVAATSLRHALRESTEEDRRRFLEECVIPEVFATLSP